MRLKACQDAKQESSNIQKKTQPGANDVDPSPPSSKPGKQALSIQDLNTNHWLPRRLYLATFWNSFSSCSTGEPAWCYSNCASPACACVGAPAILCSLSDKVTLSEANGDRVKCSSGFFGVVPVLIRTLGRLAQQQAAACLRLRIHRGGKEGWQNDTTPRGPRSFNVPTR